MVIKKRKAIYLLVLNFKKIIGNDFVKAIAEDMYKNLYERTKTHFTNSIMLAATFMDPRYRNLKFIKDQVDRDSAMFKAAAYIKNVYKHTASKILEEPEIVVADNPNTKANKAPNKKHFSLLCVEEDEDLPPALSTNEIIIKELHTYSTLRVTVFENSCPLNFYKLHEDRLPNMARIAKMLFCITASSVPSECLFSSAGQLISEKRTRLQPECAEDLLLLAKNKFD